MVHLVAKTIDFEIENFGINLFTHVTVEKGKYTFVVKGMRAKMSFWPSYLRISRRFLKRFEFVQQCLLN